MANTTFSGPVRSENGFQSVSKNATTGAFTTLSSIGTDGKASFDANSIANVAGAGITDATTPLTSVIREGDIITTKIFIDLAGLDSSGTAGDIIGEDANTDPAYIARVTAADQGTIVSVRMECLEVPATGEPNIDLYSATEGTGAFDNAITGLTETQIIDSGDLAEGSVVYGQTVAADQYLYLVAQDTDDGTYSTGKLMITIVGQGA
jgi:hypothetical protein